MRVKSLSQDWRGQKMLALFSLIAIGLMLVVMPKAYAGGKKAPTTVLVPAQPKAIDGKCGEAARTYEASESALKGKFCESGKGPDSFTMPKAGSSATYICKGEHSGQESFCKVSRKAVTPAAVPQPASPPSETKLAEVPKVGQNCRWVLQSASMTAAQVFSTPGMILQSCTGPYLVPGVTTIIPGGAVTTRVWDCS